MDENKITNGSNEIKRPAPPPVVPKKQPEKNAKEKKPKDKKPEGKKFTDKNKKLLLLIPVIIAIIVVAILVAVALKNTDKSKNGDMDPVTITDNNGVPVTDAKGEPVTMVPVVVTDAEGESVTDKKGEPVTVVPVVVTKPSGEAVTDPKGNPITVVPVPVTKPSGEVVTKPHGEPVTMVPVIVTDPSGETVTKPAGEPVTLIPVPVTKPDGEVVTKPQGEPVTMVPVIVTDPSGENVTKPEGEPVTLPPIPVTDPSGEVVTKPEGEPVTMAPVPVTKPGGEIVTDPEGEPVTKVPAPVTYPSGDVVTDPEGEVVTVIPETQIQETTNKNGEKETTIIYQDVTVTIPVTNDKGEIVTEKDGSVVTEEHVITPEPPTIPTTTKPVTTAPSTTKPAPTTLKDGTVIVGTTGVAVTDGQGNTAVDNQGEVLTTIVQQTSIPAKVETADMDWKDSLGGTAADYFSSIATLKDGGYITSIVTNSTDGDFKEFKELGYATPYTVLTKYSKNGDVVWQKALGSKRGVTIVTSLVATEDGGFYAAGYGKNIGGQTGKGYYDGAVFKFDKKGEQLWYKIFGTSTVDVFNGAALTKDGGLVVAGSVGNNDGDAEGFGKEELKSAAVVVKYSSDGSLVWKNVVGGDKDVFNGVAEDIQGNIYCVGNFYSSKLFKNRGSSDGGVVKFTSAGKYVDAACIGGRGIESFKGITACKTGGVVIVGKSNSSDAGTTDSLFVSDLASRGGYDSYIIKLESDLRIGFARAFRGQNDEELTCIVETEDGSFIAAGYSNSSTRDLKGVTTRGGNDMVIACFSRYGDLSWARSFGGTKDESANAICLGSNGGYVVVGRTISKDIDLKGIAQYIKGKSVGVIVKFPE